MMSMHMRIGFIYLFPQNFSFLCCKPTSVSLSTISESQVQKYHFHPQSASQVPFALTTLEAPQNSEKVLSFFIESGFSATQLRKILRTWPKLLSVNLDKTVKAKMKIFQNFGFSSDEIIEIVSKDPLILKSSADERIIPSLYLLKGLLGSTAQVAEVLKSAGCGNYLKIDLNETMVPSIDFLMSCGVSREKIIWHVKWSPYLLMQRPRKFKKLVEKVEKMGVDRRSNMFIYCLRVISTMSNKTWRLKLKTLRDVGFSRQDILKTFRVWPQVFATSEEKIRKIKEIILATGKYDASCIVKEPTSLGHSIKKRYKPRIEVLKILEEKKLIKKWPAFVVIYSVSDKRFVDRFVSPYYDEVGEVYMSMISPSDEREVNSVPSPSEIDLSH